MIHFLDERGKLKTRSLYEAAFPEDSKEFVDYYYDWKIRENDIIVMEEPESSDLFQVMIHFNYHMLWINGIVRKIPYIAAVATRPDCRRQGNMKHLMKWALQEVERQSVPFVFLMPKDPAYYSSQGFAHFPCQVQPVITAEGKFHLQSSKEESLQPHLAADNEDGMIWQEQLWEKAKEQDIPDMVEFSNHFLEKRYQMFVRRDDVYYKRLLVETEAEHGGVLLMRSEGKLQGLLVYGMEEKMEIQELLLESEGNLQNRRLNSQSASYGASFPPMNMMVRITELFGFVSLMRSVEPRSYRIKLTDTVISNSNGCFWIETGQAEGRIKRTKETGKEQEMDIAGLAKLLLAETQVYIREWV